MAGAQAGGRRWRGPRPGRSSPGRQRQRRPRVELESGALAGLEPAGRRRRSSPRCPSQAGPGHDSGTPSASDRPPTARAAPSSRPLPRRARSSGRRSPGRADRLRGQHVHDRVLESPGKLRSRCRGQRGRRIIGRQPFRDPGLGDDPPGRRLEPEKLRSTNRPSRPAGTRRRGERPFGSLLMAGPPG